MDNWIFLGFLFIFSFTSSTFIVHPCMSLSLGLGGSVASPSGPVAPECGPAVGSVLPVSGPAAILRLEQALHPGVHHTHLLPHLLPTPHHCCRWRGHQDVFVHSMATCHDCLQNKFPCVISMLVKSLSSQWLWVLVTSFCIQRRKRQRQRGTLKTKLTRHMLNVSTWIK